MALSCLYFLYSSSHIVGTWHNIYWLYSYLAWLTSFFVVWSSRSNSSFSFCRLMTSNSRFLMLSYKCYRSERKKALKPQEENHFNIPRLKEVCVQFYHFNRTLKTFVLDLMKINVMQWGKYALGIPRPGFGPWVQHLPSTYLKESNVISFSLRLCAEQS